MKKLVFLACLLLALPVLGQTTAKTDRDRTDQREPARETMTDKERLRERILRTSRIPEAADEAREAGIPEEDVEQVLGDARRRRLPPEETTEVLTEGAASARENGPVDNFGAFVQTQLDEGLRGRELADAIHREHAAHGKGPYKDRGEGHRGKGKGKDKGKDVDGEDHDHEDGHDDDDDHDQDRKDGKTKSKGKGQDKKRGDK